MEICAKKKKIYNRIERGRDTHLTPSGRLMLLYIGCRAASPPSSIGSWFPNQLLPPPPPLFLCSSKTLFAQVDSDTVLNEPQWVPPPPYSFTAYMAVNYVISSESRWASRELEVEAPARFTLDRREGENKEGIKNTE